MSPVNRELTDFQPVSLEERPSFWYTETREKAAVLRCMG
ncbi:hypothetical protein BACCAP_02433 [Pseudoflavonifractor capillosus ATCC 29799]|uniref:Uncharacterized protein n=1 Tax=Pseudoflavonifractor capillosus ATCC 29799 TaxID=411467 RepID=A6NW40_9FIRM|nr:hypothetical protein BACCAP_02433 [Pseudoflavonifractor capillosus ATCC 29799]